ncbi:hypothetical protein GOBAR_AA31304 [Gossypium barbadense]|uniref:CNNM transmembrane domain-containing protein n=1 Tax=Gossypium barbadense TaxID=3634 RepID=A0A2P5WE76_GOSBA|nr:hypothetical protein GOBAR_AA31304 [Gossypium barbadense]
MVCGVLAFGCKRVFAVEGVVNAGYGVIGQSILLLKNAWPKLSMLIKVFKEQGLVLTALLGLSAFFSMAETAITTLWPWKIRELAEKESEDGVFKMLRSDVTRFLTTILIGTTCWQQQYEAALVAATDVMTVAILLLTEITPKSIAVHNPTEVARFVVRPVAWLSVILYPVGRVVTFLSMGMLKILGLKGKSQSTAYSKPVLPRQKWIFLAFLGFSIELKLTMITMFPPMDMIENVLEIKDTHVREVMTPLVDVVAIDASSTLVEFHNLWLTHQYSRLCFRLHRGHSFESGRVPVFEQRVDNIVGIAYAMDLLDYVTKGEVLESTTVGDMAHKPAYFVPDSMLVWNLLREFRIRKVHMAVVLDEYGGTVGLVTLEDVVEEIVGEIFDENDSNEEIQKKTGYIVMRAEGIFDEHQYETVSGFVCEAFGYIPRTGESIKVVLEKGNEEEDDENAEAGSDQQDMKESHQIYKLEAPQGFATLSCFQRFEPTSQHMYECILIRTDTNYTTRSIGICSNKSALICVVMWVRISRGKPEILAGNARKVSAVRFERINEEALLDDTAVTPMISKIIKRKWSTDEDSNNGNYNEDTFEKRQEEDISDHYVIADYKEDKDGPNEQ